jgi:hypothetical protein
MTEERLAQAWPHIRSAIDILLLGVEFQAQPQAPVVSESMNPDQREAIIRQIREIFNDAEPAEPSPVRIAGDKISGGVRWGTWRAIARELNVTPQCVRQVATGNSVSKRVSDALARHGIETVRKVKIGDAA